MKKNDKSTGFLGKDTEFEGKFTFEGTTIVDGHLKGEIQSDGTLIVGLGGMIEAKVHASTLVINGEIHGDLIAEKRIDIHRPGRVFGNIQAPIIVIKEGAIFEGDCQMRHEKSSDM